MKFSHFVELITVNTANDELLRRITATLFVCSEGVSRHNKSMKIDFPLTLMAYHRKIGTIIKKQNTMANWASIKDSI